MIARLARRYGASPWHLAGHLVYLALAAYVLAQLLDRPAAVNIVSWLVAAIVIHDLVVLPLYSLLDRVMWRVAPRPLAAALRTAAVLSGLTLLVFFPPILGLNDRTFAHAAGDTPSGYLGRWLALVATVTVVSLGVAVATSSGTWRTTQRPRRARAGKTPGSTAGNPRVAGGPPADEHGRMTADHVAGADSLPQLDASSLVDGDRLTAAVKEMYTHVARAQAEALHFEVGRSLAEHLGYPADLLDAIPEEAVASFAGVGYHLDLAALEPGDRVLDLGSGSGTDLFCAAVIVGTTGHVVGIDTTPEQIRKAVRLRDQAGFSAVEIVDGRIESLPFAAGSFDAVISNGVINLALDKARVFAEAARVLRPGGRLAITDMVSARALKEQTRRNVELWAACIAGAVPRDRYLDAIAAAGMPVTQVRTNDYRFISDRALEACSTYGVESVSIAAQREGRTAGQ